MVWQKKLRAQNVRAHFFRQTIEVRFALQLRLSWQEREREMPRNKRRRVFIIKSVVYKFSTKYLPTYAATMPRTVDEFLFKNIRSHSGRILYEIFDNMIFYSKIWISDFGTYHIGMPIPWLQTYWIAKSKTPHSSCTYQSNTRPNGLVLDRQYNFRESFWILWSNMFEVMG